MSQRASYAIVPLTLLLIAGAGQVLFAHQSQAQDSCDPNYEGACVPIASDVDCAGGSGNGPEYVRGPVYVVGTDIYELDRDGDGVACEPK
jgi:Excalibur calcium-binding domain